MANWCRSPISNEFNAGFARDQRGVISARVHGKRGGPWTYTVIRIKNAVEILHTGQESRKLAAMRAAENFVSEYFA